MSDPFDFTGKVALVTGSSRGIGAGMASALAQRGARCVINYVADPEGRNLADAESVAGGLPDACVLPCDVGDSGQVAAMMAEIEQKFGGFDILVNNAGILRDRTLGKMTEDDWRAVLRVNLDGAFHCIQKASPILRAGGRIVNVSSVSGWIGLFGQANYAASKAGLIGLARSIARELGSRSITANVIAPGFISTDMTAQLSEARRDQILANVPLGRYGVVDEVAATAVFLASDAAAYISGVVLPVDGGLGMGI
jgi:3-oxoacyl-[acyl-carrier protein] reductase